jgi:Pyruvate/2-oxoacid:ferredoxin oxidoreductase gamma subunit
MLVNSPHAPDGLAGRVIAVPAADIAAERGSKYANLVMLGATAAAVCEPPLEALEEAARAHFGKKLGAEAADAIADAIRAGYEGVALIHA